VCVCVCVCVLFASGRACVRVHRAQRRCACARRLERDGPNRPAVGPTETRWAWKKRWHQYATAQLRTVLFPPCNNRDPDTTTIILLSNKYCVRGRQMFFYFSSSLRLFSYTGYWFPVGLMSIALDVKYSSEFDSLWHRILSSFDENTKLI